MSKKSIKTIAYELTMGAAVTAYADCNELLPAESRHTLRNLSFRAPHPLSAADATKVVKAMLGTEGTYNEFSVDVFKALTRTLNRTKATYRIAREGSVCIYVENLNPALESLLQQSSTIRALKVDECNRGARIPGTVRLWWD